jgi:hypothetical protein
LSIVDANTLLTVRQFSLHQGKAAPTAPADEDRSFRGVISVVSSLKSDTFGVVTHDESGSDEVFVGSFSSGQIVRTWALGHVRAATRLGETSVSVNDDGSLVAVSVLPDQKRVPKVFENLRLYKSSNGEMVKSIRAKGLIGQIAFMPGGDILATRIDGPGFFSKAMCIEEWNLESGTEVKQFCDHGRNVALALDASPAAQRVAGFGAHGYREMGGIINTAHGRVDLWDLQSGELLASIGEFSQYVSLKISPNGQWMIAGPILLHYISH